MAVTNTPKDTYSVFKGNDGRYVAQVIIGKTKTGKYKYKRFTSKKRSDAVARMRDFLEKSAASVRNDTNIEDIYLVDFLKSYVTEVKSQALKPTSYDREINTCNQIINYLGTYLIGDLTPAIITSSLIGGMKKDNYSYSSTHKALVLLNQCLEYAVDNDKLVSNPCRKVAHPSRKVYKQKEIRFLTDDEIKRFFSQAFQTYSTGRPKYACGGAIAIIIYTGLRAGELGALTWDDIDFKNQLIYVRRNVAPTKEYDEDCKIIKRKVIVQKGTKTNDGRIIHMNKQSEYYLKLLYDTRTGNSNYVAENFSTPDKPVIATRLSSSYVSICKAAGITNPQGVHTLRHTFASLMIRHGVDIKVLSEILGHKDVAFTYNIYVHIIDEQKAKAMQLLDLE